VAVPIASFSYVFVALISVLFLNEMITLLRRIGMFLILTGVMVVSVSSRLKGSMVT
jgi:uncharacterized membrane protein